MKRNLMWSYSAIFVSMWSSVASIVPDRLSHVSVYLLRIFMTRWINFSSSMCLIFPYPPNYTLLHGTSCVIGSTVYDLRIILVIVIIFRGALIEGLYINCVVQWIFFRKTFGSLPSHISGKTIFARIETQ